MSFSWLSGLGPTVTNRKKPPNVGVIDFSVFEENSVTFYGKIIPNNKKAKVVNLTPGVAFLDSRGYIGKLASGTARFIIKTDGVSVPVTLSFPAGPVTPTAPIPENTALVNYLLSCVTDELIPLITGLSGGAANMDLWSARDTTIPSYTRNTQMWAYSLVSQLSGVVAYKDDVTGSRQSYGGILVTPRHVLYCDHAKPHAKNTWPVNYGSNKEAILHFVLGDNSVVTAEQISQTTRQSSRSRPGAYIPEDWPAGATSAPDLCVATLDRDVQQLGCHVVPIPSLSNLDASQISGQNIPTFNVTQGVERTTSATRPSPISDYAVNHNAMLAIGRGDRRDTPYENFDYQVWDGDSGTPALFLAGGVFYLERILLYYGGGGINPALFVNHINEMIQVSDADAVNRGLLTNVTGLQVSPIEIVLPT
jgi:hypothetical protein